MDKYLLMNILLVPLLFLAAACAPRPRIDPLSVAPGGDPDPEFSQAVEQAHETMDTFFAGYFSPSPTLSFAGLRVRLESSGEEPFEYHWTEFVDYYGEVFTVRLLDGLTIDMGLHSGSTVEVPREDVVDWIIVEQDGTFTGGYTVRLAYERMTPEEKRKFIEATGYVME